VLASLHRSSEPAQFGVFRPLIDDEDRGFLLLDALDAAQRAQTIIHDVAPPRARRCC
jgi:hypothetical protein